MQRYFAIDSKLNLSKTDLHHIINVMRMKENKRICIIQDGKTYLCNIDSVSADNIKTSIINEIDELNEMPVDVTIAMALVKESKFDLILQKATELGAHSIIPLNTERSIVKIAKEKELKKRERWIKICKEAAEQSNRTVIPAICNIENINDLKGSDYDLKLICSTGEKTTNIKEILQKNKNYDKLLVVIGPEGGLSTKEEQKLVASGFIPVSLGNRILRTETAPIFVLSILNYEFMR